MEHNYTQFKPKHHGRPLVYRRLDIELYNYIVEYFKLNKVAPTIRDMANHFRTAKGKATSTSTIKNRLDKLERGGLITLSEDQYHRKVEIVGGEVVTIFIPPPQKYTPRVGQRVIPQAASQ